MLPVRDLATHARRMVAVARERAPGITRAAWARTQVVGRAAWAHRPADEVIAAWGAGIVVAGIVVRAGGGVYVSLAGVVLLMAPAYGAVFWLIHERQAGRDAAEEATRTSRAAYRKAQAIEDHLDADTPPTGRHAR